VLPKVTLVTKEVTLLLHSSYEKHKTLDYTYKSTT